MPRKFSTEPSSLGGQKLAAYIEAKGRHAVSMLIGSDVITLSRIVSGSHKITVPEALRIEEALGIALTDWVATP